MALSDSIKVRLREGQALVYAAQAEQRGVGIAAFIRDRLDQIDRVEEELASIRAAMIDMGETLDELRDQAEKQPVVSAQDKQAIGEPSAVQIETLLLLRAMTGTQTLQMIRPRLSDRDWNLSEYPDRRQGTVELKRSRYSRGLAYGRTRKL